MTVRISYIYIILISIFFFSSCSRERIEPTPLLNEYESINSYMDTKKAEEQIFEITEDGPAPIIGKDSTKIWISKQILMFPDQSDVEWPFTVKLVELYTAKDMIYYQMPTVAGVKVLETEGEIRVRAFKADADGVMQELLLKPDETFAIEMPSDSTRDDLYVYYGNEVNGYTDWVKDASSIGVNSGDLYFSEESQSHSANIGRLGWINCGKPHLGSNSISFSSDEDDLSNVGIFAYLPKYRTVIKARNLSTTGVLDSTMVKVVGIGINSSNALFSFYIEEEIINPSSANVTMQAISDQELEIILDNL